MARAESSEDLIGRREHVRVRLDLSARLVGFHCDLRVQLEDISAMGACIRLMYPQRFESGRLRWLGHAAFGRAVWNEDLRYGLLFDDPLTSECLKQTIEFANLVANDTGEKYGKLASAWVHGPGDW